MFWKISRENHEADLLSISCYLLSVFEFAAKSESRAFEKEEWLHFSPEDGAWFWKLYKKKAENGAKMRQAIDLLFALERAARKRIYEAVAHDMRFGEDLSVPFEFQSTQLKAGEQELIKDFFLYFYEVVFCKTHFHLKNLSGPYGRKELADAYFRHKNKMVEHVCPVCLQGMTNARKAPVEHYFGKAFVPCLALHPGNLYFICTECNSGYKGEKRPLYRQELNIRKSFLPYVDTVKDKVRLEFSHEKDKDGIQLKPLDEQEENVEEKLEVFEKLFCLEERWSGLMPSYYDTLRIQFGEQKPDSPEELQRSMKGYLRLQQLGAEGRPERYLEAKYLEWVCNVQLRAFYAELTQDKKRRH